MLILRSPAKVNLCLDVLGKGADGYHEISTVICIAENYFDEITLEINNQENSLSIITDLQNPTPQRIDKNEENLLNRAISLMENEQSLLSSKKIQNKFAEIIVHKKLPFSSGLGSFSSNAATIMMGLNELWDLKLSKEKLKTLGAQLGMDVPFFFEGGLCLCTHFGEIVEPIATDLKFEIEITARSDSRKDKTAHSFNALDLSKCGHDKHKTQAFVEALKSNDKKEALQLLHNDFEQLYPGLANSTPRRHLAGSGPSTFTLKVSI